jgi:predicted transcriptional regulator
VNEVGRRGSGELEAAILQALWDAGRPLTPVLLHAALGADLAYNTVHTVLTRMCEKGVLRRTRIGARMWYEPVLAPADHGAARLHAVLDSSDDRHGLLRRFIDTLSPEDEEALRAMLDE